jgi:hypothetical protein
MRKNAKDNQFMYVDEDRMLLAQIREVLFLVIEEPTCHLGSGDTVDSFTQNQFFLSISSSYNYQ